MKRFISTCCALMLCIGCCSVAVSAEETEPTRVYRTSVDGTAIANSNWKFVFALEAYSNGHIHINVQ